MQEACARILKSSRRNRNPSDKVYLEFLALVNKRSYSSEDYERLARPIIELHPDPWQLKSYIAQRALEQEDRSIKPKRKRPRKRKRRKAVRNKDESTGLLVDEDGLSWLPPDWEIGG